MRASLSLLNLDHLTREQDLEDEIAGEFIDNADVLASIPRMLETFIFEHEGQCSPQQA